jgi:hypothetical protein
MAADATRKHPVNKKATRSSFEENILKGTDEAWERFNQGKGM